LNCFYNCTTDRHTYTHLHRHSGNTACCHCCRVAQVVRSIWQRPHQQQWQQH